MKKEELRDLIDSLELYLKLINNDLPELKEENKKVASNLEQLVIESRKVTNLGNLLVELKETFNEIKKDLSQNHIHAKRIEQIVNQNQTLKSRLNIVYALLIGILAGYAINHLLPI
jgi:uncharacterized coiled-coil DUF342 family protein